MDTLTIKQLRAKLSELEAAWPLDECFGKFEDQTIMVDAFYKHETLEHAFLYGGVSHAEVNVDYTLGIIIAQQGGWDKKRNS